jgi:hypothetical protein
MLVAPSAIATAMETSAIPRSTSGDFPARASAGPSAAVSPARSASLRSSTAPAGLLKPADSHGHRAPIGCTPKRDTGSRPTQKRSSKP